MKRHSKPKKNDYHRPEYVPPVPRYRAPRKIKEQRRAADKMKIDEFMQSLEEMEKGINRLTEKELSPEGWTQNAASVIEEIRDILIDYDRLAEQVGRLLEKYEHASPARLQQDGSHRCPACGQSVFRADSYCHWCGKKLRERDRWE